MARNPYVAQFHADLSARYPVDGADMSYSDWISLNTKLAGRPFRYDGYEFQKAIVDDMSTNLAVIKPSQVGMALSLDTLVPTSTGWTTMGDVKVGDTLFDEQGQTCEVTYISPVYTDHPCFRITFDTGEQIVADENHRWYVEALSPFKGEVFHRSPGRAPEDFSKSGVLRTGFLAKTFERGNRHVYAIPNAGVLDLPDQDLPIDPYFLGLWLGDGNSHACVVTSTFDDLAFYEYELLKRGMICVPSSNKEDTIQFCVHLIGQTNHPGRGQPNSLSYKMNQNGLAKGQKFIPDVYLRSSKSQRLDLLRGLLDTDGSISKNGRVSFYNTDRNLVDGVRDLVHSLGYKARTRWRKPSTGVLKNGHVIQSKKMIAELSFISYAEDAVFLLPRKRQRLQADGRRSESLRRRIVNIEPVDPVPVRCIQVDSPNHLFLAGEGMIPTHNTEVQVRKFLAFLTRHRGTSGIFTFPNEKMFKKNSKTRIKPIIQQPAFNSQAVDDDKPVRAVDLFEINGSFAHITGMTEGDATSTPADILFHDEVDLSDQTMIGLFQSRLQNSDFKINQKFSTPTHPMFGIDAAYQSSDQRQYMVRCRCNHWQAPRFHLDFLHLAGYTGDGKLDEIDADMAAKIDFSSSYVRCFKCSQPLDLTDPSIREWVAEFPARRGRGYKISPFSPTHGRLSLSYIVDQLLKMRQLDNIRGWYNTVLGETYSDGTSKLEPDVVKAIMKSPSVPEVGKEVQVALGCDMGKTCHLTAGAIRPGGETEPFLFEQVPSSQIHDRILQLCDQYNVVTGGVDRHPYTPDSERIRDSTNRKVLPIEYRGSTHLAVVEDEFGALDYVRINRTAAIDAQVRAIQRRSTAFSGYGAMGQILVEQCCDMVRIEHDEQPAVWQKLTGNDHFLHSLTLMRASVKVREVLSSRFVTENRSMVGLISVNSPPLVSQIGTPISRQMRLI
jgi:hypothetical protein